MIPCIAQDGSYGFVDTLPPGAIEVPERPHPCCTWNGTSWVDDLAALWDEVRAARAPLLIEADHRYNRALDLGEPTPPISEYRQALRDITLQPDPRAVVWPTKPW